MTIYTKLVTAALIMTVTLAGHAENITIEQGAAVKHEIPVATNEITTVSFTQKVKDTSPSVRDIRVKMTGDDKTLLISIDEDDFKNGNVIVELDDKSWHELVIIHTKDNQGTQADCQPVTTTDATSS